jgi:hypothetical protein
MFSENFLLFLIEYRKQDRNIGQNIGFSKNIGIIGNIGRIRPQSILDVLEINTRAL